MCVCVGGGGGGGGGKGGVWKGIGYITFLGDLEVIKKNENFIHN